MHQLPWEPKEEMKPNGGKVEDGEEKKPETLSPLRRRPIQVECLLSFEYGSSFVG